MKWAEISIEAGVAAEEAVADILMDAGCGGTASHGSNGGSRVFGYLPADDQLEGRLTLIRNRINLLPALGLYLPSTEIRVKWVSDEDWTTAYRTFLKPVRIGRIYVTPSWELEQDGETPAELPCRSDIVIQIDPGMAFGTGHHETTRLCLAALQDLVKGGETVLDVGTGSGILAIAAVKLGAARAVGIEIDPTAARIAIENATKNGVSDLVKVIVGDSPRAFDEQSEIVLANILPDVIVAMAEDLRASLKPGGKLVTSGIIRDRANDVKMALESLGMPTVDCCEEGDWVALISERPA